jgi:5-methylcytosine-specific restriction protein A
MTKPQYGGAWPRIRLDVLERDGYLCQIQAKRCTSQADQVDHIVPVHLGGAWHDPMNLRASCSNCNNGRTYKAKTAKPSRVW